MNKIMMQNKEKGFTVIEMLIVLLVLGIILVIAVPNMLDYYWQQRFNQDVQSIIASFRRSAIRSVSSNHWIGLVMHPNCPFPQEGGKFCMQTIRLPLGKCGLSIWPTLSEWEAEPNCDGADSMTLCEYKTERFVMEKWFKVVDLASVSVYIIGPDGTITVQNGPIANPICSDLPIPDPVLQMVFEYEKRPLFKGVCVSGRGNVYATEIEDDKLSLNCPI